MTREETLEAIKVMQHYADGGEVGGQRIEEQREWVGLTKDEIIDIIIEAFGSPYDVAVDVEAKLKEKNT